MFADQSSYKGLKIFAASPRDVERERKRLGKVVEELNRTGNLAEFLQLKIEVMDWRTHVAPLMGRPEGVVLEQLPVETWDIFVGVLWLRFGTPTGAVDPGTDCQFASGTQEEFSLAYSSWKKYGRPKILFYRCTRVPSNLDGIDPDQHKHVKNFFAQFEVDAKHPGLYKSFQITDEFERCVREDLSKLLVEYGKKELNVHPPQSVVEFAAPRIPDTLPRRAPFFGRQEEMAIALRALSCDDRGWGLVIEGIGGIGKTALAVEVAYQCKEHGAFDAFVFVSAKHERLEWDGIKKETLVTTTLEELVNETARALGIYAITQLTNRQAKQRALLDALRGKRALVIFDNLETLSCDERNAISDFLRVLPQDCKAIITSREAIGESCISLPLRELKWDDARELMQAHMKQYGANLRALTLAGEPGLKQLYDAAGGSPLAMLWAIGLIRSRGLAFNRALEILRHGESEDNLNMFIYQEVWKRMELNERTVLGALSLFGGIASSEALTATASLDKRAADSALSRLMVLNLVDMIEVSAGEGLFEKLYTLHPLTKRFARTNLAKNVNAEYALGLRHAQYWVRYVSQYGYKPDEEHLRLNDLGEVWSNLVVRSISNLR